MIDKITWQKAGRVAQPGRYMFTFGWLTVTAEDLRVWGQFPDAAFTLVRLPRDRLPKDRLPQNQFPQGNSGSDGDGLVDEFHLGAFEIPLKNTAAAARDPHGEA